MKKVNDSVTLKKPFEGKTTGKVLHIRARDPEGNIEYFYQVQLDGGPTIWCSESDLADT